MEYMYEKLRQALSSRQKKKIDKPNLTQSAVLIPIFSEKGQYNLLFTKRTETVKYHKGQISFPGGARERNETLMDTVLRECSEEIGLAPDDVAILGTLDDAVPVASPYVISPFVAAIPWPYQFRLNRHEIEEIVEVPIPVLLDKSCVRQGTEVVDNEIINNYSYHCGNRVIWGATARILHQFLDILTQISKD